MSAILPLVLAEISGSYGIFVAATLHFYDYLLTWPDEKRLIWEGKRSLVKALFLFIRCMGLTVTIAFLWSQTTTSFSSLSCGILYYFCMGGYILLAHASGLVLALRTWAIWERRFTVGVLVGVVWTSVTVISSVFLIYTCIGLNPSLGMPVDPGVLVGCSSTEAPETPDAASWGLRTFTCLSVYEGFIFIMTVIRGAHYIYDAKPSGLTFVLYRDAFLASFCLLALNVINLILESQDNTWFYLPYHLGHTFYFIAPCRIILNLRAFTAGADPDWTEMLTMGETRTPTESISLSGLNSDG